jgi:hypothetical protein
MSREAYVFQEDEAQRDVLVVGWLHIAAQLVGDLEHLGLKTELAAVFVRVVLNHRVLSCFHGSSGAT